MASMANLLDPATNPELFADQSSRVVAAGATLLVFPTVAVFLRLLSRWMSRAGFWWDDYTAVLAMVFSWGPNIINLVATHHGFGKHLAVLPIETVFNWFKYLYAFEFVYELAINSVKFSFILFQYRILPVVHYRRVLVGCLVVVSAQFIAFVLVSTFQCIPIHDFWETLAGELSAELGGTCINVQTYFIASGAINIVTNFILLALPIPLLWRLRTSRLQKLTLTGIFTVGLTVCAVSIVRLIVLSDLDRADLTWNFVTPAIWTAAEPSIAVVSACLPSFRPLFVRLIWGRSYRPKQLSRSHGSNSQSKSLTTFSWRSGKDEEGMSGRFDKLNGEEVVGYAGKPWTNNVDVRRGSEEFDWGGGERGKGIHVRTTVTVSETVDWRDDLF